MGVASYLTMQGLRKGGRARKLCDKIGWVTPPVGTLPSRSNIGIATSIIYSRIYLYGLAPAIKQPSKPMQSCVCGHIYQCCVGCGLYT